MSNSIREQLRALKATQELLKEAERLGLPAAAATIMRMVDTLLRGGVYCRYEIEDSKDKYTLYVELPGTSKEDVEVYVREKSVVVTAKPKVKLPSAPSEYKVVVSLDEEVKPEYAKAKMRNGILVVELPKSVVGRKVEVD